VKYSCYFAFNHSVLLCPNLYSTNLHNSLRTCSILVLVLSTALHCNNLSYNRSSLYRLRTGHTENTSHVIATQRVHWRANCCLAESYKIRPIVAGAYRGMFIEKFPNNALSKFVTIFKQWNNVFTNRSKSNLRLTVLSLFGGKSAPGAGEDK
jgi:hypothetical protein